MRRFSDHEVVTGDFIEKVIFACRTMRQFLNYLNEILVGNTTQDIDATQVMEDFFSDHPLNATNS